MRRAMQTSCVGFLPAFADSCYWISLSRWLSCSLCLVMAAAPTGKRLKEVRVTTLKHDVFWLHVLDVEELPAV